MAPAVLFGISNMHKAENKEIPIVPEATVVKSGVVRVMELQEKGWTYVRPETQLGVYSSLASAIAAAHRRRGRSIARKWVGSILAPKTNQVRRTNRHA
jgi:hypothetical protein